MPVVRMRWSHLTSVRSANRRTKPRSVARQINVSNSATSEITRKLAYNNVFDNNQKGGVCLPFENPRSSGNLSDWNVFTRPPSFRLNKYQDTFQWQTVLDKLQQAGFTIGPESTDAQGEGAFRQFGLDAWRVATGWDLHSVVVEKADIDVQPYRMLMRVSWPETWRDLRMNCHFPMVDLRRFSVHK